MNAEKELIEKVEVKLRPIATVEAFENDLDERYPVWNIAGSEFTTSYVLKAIDYSAYLVKYHYFLEHMIESKRWYTYDNEFFYDYAEVEAIRRQTDDA
jgi:hypothetical protein